MKRGPFVSLSCTRPEGPPPPRVCGDEAEKSTEGRPSWLAGWRDSPPFTRDRCGDMEDEPEVVREKTRAERDAEGWANAIVLSSDDDDEPPAAPPRPSGASSSKAAGKRPVAWAHDEDDVKPDVKPDVKKFKPDDDDDDDSGGAFGAPPPAPAGPAIAQTDLEDLSFSAPLKGAMGEALRAGHIMIKLSSQPVADSTHVHIGSGRESSSHERLQACPWSVRMDDGTHGQALNAIRRLANPFNTRSRKHPRGYALVEVDWQPKLPWRLKRGGVYSSRPSRSALSLAERPHAHVSLPWSRHTPCASHTLTWPRALSLSRSPARRGATRHLALARDFRAQNLRMAIGAELLLRYVLRGFHSGPAHAPLALPCSRPVLAHAPPSVRADVWCIMDRLTPMSPIVETPRPPPVQSSAVLAPCGAATAPNRAALPAPSSHAFTLAGLMRALESAGYEEMADPPGLLLTLYPFQRQSLHWMFDRETLAGGLNALFWREHPSEGRRSFWYNPMAGELRDRPLPIVTGGFLCEEMGLGKVRVPRLPVRGIATRPSRHCHTRVLRGFATALTVQ